MAYQSLYRRYRPRRFADMRGQEHVVLALRNAVRDDRLGHAHLFSGPRGTGKTTSARILAKVLNCTNVQDGEPCCECASCLSVEAGNSYDVHELDAASNNGVDAMRDLIEKTMLGTPGRHKVYILDEVHMLSKAAEAALLKTLEEPPPHVVFVLATTDPQKVSETIRSRCQKLQFHLLSADVLTDHVKWVIKDAGLTVDDAAIETVVRQGAGSARDTLSALEQVVVAGGVAADTEPLDDLVEALIESDSGRAITAVAAAVNDGRDARTLTENLVAHLRDCFLSLMAPELVQLPDRSAQRVLDQAKRLGVAPTVRAMEVLGEMLVELRHAPDPRLLLDVNIVRLTNPSSDTSVAGLLARIEKLEHALASGTPIVASASAPARPTTAAGPASAPARAATDRPAATAPERPAGSTPSAAQAKAERLAGGSTAIVEDDAPPTPSPAAAQTPPAERAKLGARVARPTAAATSSASSAAATNQTDEPGPTAAAVSPDVAPPAASGLPSLDELALQWADHVLPKLKGLSKAFFAPGRFLSSEATSAVFAVPSTTPLARLEQLRPEIEVALAKHFGRSVPLKIVHDPADKPADKRAAASEPYEDEVYDPAELVDAPPGSSMGGLDKLVEAFPGAELIQEAE